MTTVDEIKIMDRFVVDGVEYFRIGNLTGRWAVSAVALRIVEPEKVKKDVKSGDLVEFGACVECDTKYGLLHGEMSEQELENHEIEIEKYNVVEGETARALLEEVKGGRQRLRTALVTLNYAWKERRKVEDEIKWMKEKK